MKKFLSKNALSLMALIIYAILCYFNNELSWYYVAIFITVIIVLLGIVAYKFFMQLIEQWSK